MPGHWSRRLTPWVPAPYEVMGRNPKGRAPPWIFWGINSSAKALERMVRYALRALT